MDCDSARQGKTFCVFSALDLGIGLGVAVDVFNDFGVDNRIQWTWVKHARVWVYALKAALP